MIRREHNKDITSLNTFGIRTSCAAYIEYDSPEDLLCIDWDNLAGPVLSVGKGSNLLFTAPFPGTVLHSAIKGIELLGGRSVGDIVYVHCGAAVIFDDFCAWAAGKELWGVENLSAIPGTVGASAVQNIGAYGVEAADVIDSVECFRIADRKFVSFNAAECDFGYRDSFFKHHRGEYVVVGVVFRLTSLFSPVLSYGHLKEEVERNAEILPPNADPYGPLYSSSPSSILPVTPRLVRDTVKVMREEKLPDPSKVGSAGSFFKNPVVSADLYDRAAALVRSERGEDAQLPHFDLEGGLVKIPAAFLIDFCGFKGVRCGDAGVWPKQALVLVNATGRATAEEILHLEENIKNTVRERFGIELEPEVDHI